MQRQRVDPARLQPQERLGRRMALALLPLIILPILVLGMAAFFRARALLRQQVVTQMEHSVDAQVNTLEEWRRTHELRMMSASQNQTILTLVPRLLQDDQRGTAASVLPALQQELQTLNSGSPRDWYAGMMVVRLSDGLILASVPDQWQGLRVNNIAAMPPSATHITTSAAFPGAPEVSLLTLMPIPTGEGEPKAALIGIANDLEIHRLTHEEAPPITSDSDLYLGLPPDKIVGFVRAAAAWPWVEMHSAHHPVFDALNTAETGQIEHTGLKGVPVISVYRWLPSLGTAVILEIPQSTVFAGLNTLTGFTVALMLGGVVMVFVIVPWAISRAIRPLATLATVAERFARGEWDRRVPVERPDEVGQLAATFNRMAEDLSGLYRTLEARVEERTRQVRTAAEVARAATSVPNLQELLRRAVQLICERFGYYHAGIFLLDETGKNAVLREATGEAGAALVARGHNLPVGSQSIIGWVTANGQPRVASDVSHDPIHLKNELLPGTRSEAAVPLQVGGRILGALDVQSLEPHAFSPEDLSILQMLADQLSAAIQNARLAERSALAAERARLISEVTTAMSGLTDVDRVLETAGQFVHQALGRPDVVVRLVTLEDGRQAPEPVPADEEPA